MIVAKPIIEKQFWILQKDNQKIGNVEACAGGYQVRINNTVAQYKTIKMVEQRADIRFEPITLKITKPQANLVHGYPVSGRVYNPIWDIPHHLPLFTRTTKSKSWFAAGWYAVKKGRHWITVQNPKLIVLQRYSYQGPFYTEQEATPHDKPIP